jgi:hypothetical protein
LISSKCKMPDLSNLTQLYTRLIVNWLAYGNEGLSKKTGLYRTIFVRLVDKAVHEYQEARDTLIAGVDDWSHPVEDMVKKGKLYRLTDHLENCINAVARLLQITDRMKNESATVVIDRTLRKSIESHSKSVRDVRNLIEHMEEEIQKDNLGKDKPIILKLNDQGDGAEIGNKHITFNDLAQTIRKLYEIARLLLEPPWCPPT